MSDQPPALPDDPDDLPPMRYSEAQWHAHVAATRATPGEAERTAPAVALAAAALETTTVCGIDFPPLTAGGLLSIQAASTLAENAGMRVDGPAEIAVLVFCLARSERAFALIEASELSKLVAEATRLLLPVPLAMLPELVAYCTSNIQMATGQKKTEPSATATGQVS